MVRFKEVMIAVRKTAIVPIIEISNYDSMMQSIEQVHAL